MLEVQQEQERFKRAGKEWKEEIKPHVSTAAVPPVMALPAAIAGCWVGGTALAATTQPEYPMHPQPRRREACRRGASVETGGHFTSPGRILSGTCLILLGPGLVKVSSNDV